MPTLVYNYTPPNGLTDQGLAADITFSEGTFSGKDVWRFGSTVGAQAGIKERGSTASTTFTWEDMGVPEKSYVTQVDASISKWLSQNTNLVQHDIKVQLLDASGNNICGVDNPFEATISTTADVAFTAVSDVNGAAPVLAQWRDSTTPIKMQLEVTLTTSPGTTFYILNFDTIDFSITYFPKSHNQAISVFSSFF